MPVILLLCLNWSNARVLRLVNVAVSMNYNLNSSLPRYGMYLWLLSFVTLIDGCWIWYSRVSYSLWIFETLFRIRQGKNKKYKNRVTSFCKNYLEKVYIWRLYSLCSQYHYLILECFLHSRNTLIVTNSHIPFFPIPKWLTSTHQLSV